MLGFTCFQPQHLLLCVHYACAESMCALGGGGLQGGGRCPQPSRYGAGSKGWGRSAASGPVQGASRGWSGCLAVWCEGGLGGGMVWAGEGCLVAVHSWRGSRGQCGSTPRVAVQCVSPIADHHTALPLPRDTLSNGRKVRVCIWVPWGGGLGAGKGGGRGQRGVGKEAGAANSQPGA